MWRAEPRDDIGDDLRCPTIERGDERCFYEGSNGRPVARICHLECAESFVYQGRIYTRNSLGASCLAIQDPDLFASRSKVEEIYIIDLNITYGQKLLHVLLSPRR